jgi:hypothetical protein
MSSSTAYCRSRRKRLGTFDLTWVVEGSMGEVNVVEPVNCIAKNDAANRCHGTSLVIILGSLLPGPPGKPDN